MRGLAFLFLASIVSSTWTNLTLYHLYPAHMRDRSPTGISDFWLADPFDVAFYFFRTRIGRLACTTDPTGYYCSCINETQPTAQFLYEKLIVEVQTDAFPGDDFNFGYGNYSTCLLKTGDYRENYTCSCGLFLNCKGLPNTIGRTAAHGFGTYGHDAPYGTWYSLLAQRGQHECSEPNPPRCCLLNGGCQGFHGIPDSPLNAYWYNTLRAGGCPGGVISPDCTWRVVQSIKNTNATCHDAQVDASVESLASTCLSAGSCRTDLACYTTCYMNALLGVNATTPREGLTADAINALFLKPFESDDPDEGGCPNVP